MGKGGAVRITAAADLQDCQGRRGTDNDGAGAPSPWEGRRRAEAPRAILRRGIRADDKQFVIRGVITEAI